MDEDTALSPAAKSFNVACQRCRKRKVKCDLKAPRCKNCTRAGAECVATKLSSSRAANSLPPGFIEDLEAEVERLEKEVRKMNEAGEPSSATRPESSSAGHAAYQTAGAQYPSRGDGFDWSIVGEAGAGSIHPRLGWGMSGMMQSAFSVDNSQPHVSGNPNPLFPLVRSSAGARHLSHPSMPLYLEAYFTQIHPAFPFLDEEAIRGSMNQVATTRATSDDMPLLLLVLAIGSMVIPSSNHISAYHCIELFALACDGGVMMGAKTDLRCLQFGLLATIFSMFHPSGGSTWHLIGLCVQMTVTLGLHQTRGSPSRTCDMALGEHALWTTYVLDRLVSTCMGRPFAIDSADLSTEFPADDTETRYLSLLAKLAASSSRKSNVASETGDSARVSRDLLASCLSEDRESVPPPLVLTLALQLAGWRFMPTMLTETFETDKPAFDSIMSDLGVILKALSDLKGVQPAWPLSHSILHVSSLNLYGLRLASSRANLSETLSETSSATSIHAVIALKNVVHTFRGLDGLYQILDGLVVGHYLEETMELSNGLDAVCNAGTREAIKSVVGLARNDILR